MNEVYLKDGMLCRKGNGEEENIDNKLIYTEESKLEKLYEKECSLIEKKLEEAKGRGGLREEYEKRKKIMSEGKKQVAREYAWESACWYFVARDIRGYIEGEEFYTSRYTTDRKLGRIKAIAIVEEIETEVRFEVTEDRYYARENIEEENEETEEMLCDFYKGKIKEINNKKWKEIPSKNPKEKGKAYIEEEKGEKLYIIYQDCYRVVNFINGSNPATNKMLERSLCKQNIDKNYVIETKNNGLRTFYYMRKKK